jgi:DNA-binding CsgD family transcriptional regulator
MRRYPSVRRLTPREREVALLFSDGLKPAVIAGRLNLTPQTVSAYLQRIKLRLNLATQADIVPWVIARRVPGHPDILRRASIDRLGPSAGRQQDDDSFRQRRDLSH